MPKQAKFRPTKTAEGWRLNVPPRLTRSGRRERHFYRSKEEALAEAKRLRRHLEAFGAQAAAIPPTLAEQAAAAHALLAPYGVTVLEAAARVAGAEAARLASAPVEAALAAFQHAKDGRSTKQVQAIRHMAAHLREDFAGRALSTITGQEIGGHIAARTSGPAAFNAKLRLLVTFWRWCARPPREWCRADSLAHVERRETVGAEIEVLMADDVRRLLAAAEAHHPDTVPGFAIAVFTGMRQAELERLQPGDISAEGITVPAASSKTKRRRFISLPAPLAAWLRVHPVAPSVLPANWQRKEKAVRRLAGWRVWSDLVEPHEPPEEAPAWPQNALRHTAASVAVALGKPLEQLVFEHGHSGGLEMLRRHYVGALPKSEAIAIWRIGPKNKKLPSITAA